MNIIITSLDVAFQVYTWLLIVRILLSWVRHNPYQPVIRFIYEVTEPFLSLFRRIVPPVGPVDFSPIVAFFVLHLIRQVLISFLRHFL
ncbi:MAG: YggT family protein [Pelotomaculum sp.]|uniref:Predicted integral membrane protein n=1 Tax=Pelotomaculum thermopropionicum (strain DSM 13744 / JCM 10971 / SI) TaxID=370438 RepID=A5D184_PELTS|nr:YggT family protein [Pelotomaculum sp.]BAF60006.1 predicted integral membrane protein [Pelotomaculum thermopropionicum SI]